MAATAIVTCTPTSCYQAPSSLRPSSLSCPRPVCLHTQVTQLDASRPTTRRSLARASSANGNVELHDEMLQKEVKRVIERFNLPEDEALRIAIQICERKASVQAQRSVLVESDENRVEASEEPPTKEETIAIPSIIASDPFETTVRHPEDCPVSVEPYSDLHLKSQKQPGKKQRQFEKIEQWKEMARSQEELTEELAEEKQRRLNQWKDKAELFKSRVSRTNEAVFDVFLEYDSSGDGTMSKEDLRSALAEFDIRLPPETLQSILDDLDLVEGDRLTANELQRIVQRYKPYLAVWFSSESAQEVLDVMSDQFIRMSNFMKRNFQIQFQRYDTVKKLQEELSKTSKEEQQ
ncbi:hypothetical protein GUITHDRAFT_160445 [Guillardia theta CCMP2712]|uniref:EF-hand domain-containing protein n=1 Tax=Guillardia theta (strain CCMP2712) TaxID=905079 RepID=L1K4T8_GUITC|nr:hypothetical protein GUITHDRAFT_160445 [Guillardia theta CCMP2712]EKX55358.1 hypothetical protein GUITHDRAFT_160445 [Guillardia theta CCMP2712]|eukprot:XP_005842338.1 hypothetical protein GUITHDRAFT_160445 [Guillardia theta CCMP2712]